VEFVWNLSACKFRHFTHDPTVESILWRSPSYVTEHRDFSGEPRVTPALDVVRYESMEHAKTSNVPEAKASVAQREIRHAALSMTGLAVFEDIANTS
jgi:hypothetical protein